MLHNQSCHINKNKTKNKTPRPKDLVHVHIQKDKLDYTFPKNKINCFWAFSITKSLKHWEMEL